MRRVAHRLRNGIKNPKIVCIKERMAVVAPRSRIVNISAIISTAGEARSSLELVGPLFPRLFCDALFTSAMMCKPTWIFAMALIANPEMSCTADNINITMVLNVKVGRVAET